MIYSNFTGRVAKKAKVIDGVNGQFLSMDLAVNDYSKGEEVTQWVRVQSSDHAHLKLAEFFTKGRILTIQGISKIDQWEGSIIAFACCHFFPFEPNSFGSAISSW